MFWLLTTVLAAVAAGLAPPPAARVSISPTRSAAPIDRRARASAASHARRLRDGLLVVEAAFAVILIVGASLLARSFVRLMAVDNGYTADGVLIASVELPRGATEARTDQFIERGSRAAASDARRVCGRRRRHDPADEPNRRHALHAAGIRQPVGSPRRDAPSSTGLRPATQRRSACACERDGSSSTPMRARARLATIVNQEFVRQHLAARAGDRPDDSATRGTGPGRDRGDRRRRWQRAEGRQRSTAAARAVLRPRIARPTHRADG